MAKYYLKDKILVVKDYAVDYNLDDKIFEYNLPHLVRFGRETKMNEFKCVSFVSTKNTGDVYDKITSHPNIITYANKIVTLDDKKIVSLWVALFAVKYFTGMTLNSSDVFISENLDLFVMVTEKRPVESGDDIFILNDGPNKKYWEEKVEENYNTILRTIVNLNFSGGFDEFKNKALSYKPAPLTSGKKNIVFSFAPTTLGLDESVEKRKKLENLLQDNVTDVKKFLESYNQISISEIVEVLRSFIIRKTKSDADVFKLLAQLEEKLEGGENLSEIYANYVKLKDDSKDSEPANYDEITLDKILSGKEELSKIKFKNFSIYNKKVLASRLGE